VGQIDALSSLDLNGATDLTRALRAGPWLPAQLTRLATAVSSRMAARQLPCKGTRRATQTCLTFELYVTVSDWAFLDDEAHALQAKVERMVQRALSIGLVCPSEPTLAHIAAIVITKALRNVSLAPESKHNLLGQLKALFKQHGKCTNYPYAHLVDLPVGPRQLGQRAYEHAYQGEALPSPAVLMPALAPLARSVPLRVTRAALRDAGAQPAKLRRTQASAAAPPAADAGPMHQMALLMAQVLAQMQSQGGAPALVAASTAAGPVCRGAYPPPEPQRQSSGVLALPAAGPMYDMSAGSSGATPPAAPMTPSPQRQPSSASLASPCPVTASAPPASSGDESANAMPTPPAGPSDSIEAMEEAMRNALTSRTAARGGKSASTAGAGRGMGSDNGCGNGRGNGRGRGAAKGRGNGRGKGRGKGASKPAAAAGADSEGAPESDLAAATPAGELAAEPAHGSDSGDKVKCLKTDLKNRKSREYHRVLSKSRKTMLDADAKVEARRAMALIV